MSVIKSGFRYIWMDTTERLLGRIFFDKLIVTMDLVLTVSLPVLFFQIQIRIETDIHYIGIKHFFPFVLFMI